MRWFAVYTAILALACDAPAKRANAPDVRIAADPTAEPPPEPVEAPVVEGPVVARERTYRFSYSIQKEHSCSRSFENKGSSASYVLKLQPSGTATLEIQADTFSSFGSAAGRFQPGGQVNRTHQGSNQVWKGKAVKTARGFRLELSLDSTECKALAQGGGWVMTQCKIGSELRIACERGTVEASVETDRKEEKTESVDVWNCEPPPEWADDEELHRTLPNGLPLAEVPGLTFGFHRIGMMGLGEPTIRWAKE